MHGASIRVADRRKSTDLVIGTCDVDAARDVLREDVGVHPVADHEHTVGLRLQRQPDKASSRTSLSSDALDSDFLDASITMPRWSKPT